MAKEYTLKGTCKPTPQQARRAILNVIIFTVLAAVAQPLFKIGATRLFANLTIAGLVTDLPLIVGLAVYGLGSALMILALRHGELSVLYPVLSLSYVWVAVLSFVIFHETMTPIKITGMAAVIAGVAVLGRSSRQ